MTRTQLKKLHSLCGKTEQLECELGQRKNRSDGDHRAYEAVADAKRRLLDAIREAEA